MSSEPLHVFVIKRQKNKIMEEIDFDNTTVTRDANSTSVLYSQTSNSDECEGNSDVETLGQHLLSSVIKDDTNAWLQNKVRLQLKTVDPSVKVEEWSKRNPKFSTTTKKDKKPVVESIKKIIITYY